MGHDAERRGQVRAEGLTAAADATLVGVGSGTVAGLIWGLSYLVPILLPGWSAVSVTVGRYLAYGLWSTLLVALNRQAMITLLRAYWRAALGFAIAGNLLYYLLLVIGIDLIGAAITAVIIGFIPVTMAVVGNVRRRQHRWSSMVLPVLLAVAGLVLATSAGQPGLSHSAMLTAAGLVAALSAVAIWTWFGLANARFLTDHRDMPPAHWSTVIGLFTGAVTLVCLPFCVLGHQLQPAPAAAPLPLLLAGSIILGVGVSWAATVLWNRASAELTTVLAGMLVNVETVAGYVYVYVATLRWPPLTQVIGFALLIAGVVIVLRLPTAAQH